jgi:hypothetical protein
LIGGVRVISQGSYGDQVPASRLGVECGVTVTLSSSVKTKINIYIVLAPDFKTYMHGSVRDFFSHGRGSQFSGRGAQNEVIIYI